MHYILVQEYKLLRIHYIRVQYCYKARVEDCGMDAEHAAVSLAALHTMDEGRYYNHGIHKQTLIFSLHKRRMLPLKLASHVKLVSHMKLASL